MIRTTLELGKKFQTRTGRISPTKMKRAIKACYPKSRITQTKEDDGTLRFDVHLNLPRKPKPRSVEHTGLS